MRLMSCSLTTPQVEARTKDETRRLGWTHAKRGDRVVLVEKAMGLGPGGRPRPLAVVEFIEVRREPLSFVTEDEVIREGFPFLTCAEFIARFCSHMKCKPDRMVTVIRWRYVQPSELTEDERAQWCKLNTRYALRPAGGAS